MQQSPTLEDQALAFARQCRTLLADGRAWEDHLHSTAQSLCRLAQSPRWRCSPYRSATAGEALVYELAVDPDGGPSLYLVSDGSGVVSPPHEHQTWAIIAGIEGRERNHRYRLQSAKRRTVARRDVIDVGPGQTLVMHALDIHSTEVVGAASSFHLHLYGRRLDALSPFESRCYIDPGDL